MTKRSFINEAIAKRPIIAVPIFGMFFFSSSFFLLMFFNPFSQNFDLGMKLSFFSLILFIASTLATILINPFSNKEMEENFGITSGTCSPSKDDTMSNPAYSFMPGNSYHQSYLRNH